MSFTEFSKKAALNALQIAYFIAFFFHYLDSEYYFSNSGEKFVGVTACVNYIN